MSPSRYAFPLVSLYRRIKARVATFRHGWFKVLVWFLFGAMTVFLTPGMVAIWIWRNSHRLPPREGRRVSMMLLAALAVIFQLVWLNWLVIDPLAGVGEAQDVVAVDAPTTTVPTTTSTITATTSTIVPPTTTTTLPVTETPDPALEGVLEAAEESNGGVSYDRDLYGGWSNVRSGCNTRCAVLEEEQRADGRWLSWYDGLVISDSSDLDIDHMVPLAEAHSSGGWRWSSTQKRQYANDRAHPEALTAVSASSNRSKGSRDPAEWRPSNRSAWCKYAVDWITVKQVWGLTADQAEVRALEEMLDTCDSDATITTAPAPVTTTNTVTTTTPIVVISCPYTSAAGDPCAAVPALGNQSNDVNCGDIPKRLKPLTVVGEDYDRLDGNNDGVACSS